MVMSVAVMTLYLLIVLCGCVVAIYNLAQDRDTCRKWYDDERETNIKLTKELHNLKLENMQLKDQLLLKSFYTTNNKSVADKDLLYAVKYAMKMAHPDNGGKQENFVKFNNLYNRMK